MHILIEDGRVWTRLNSLMNRAFWKRYEQSGLRFFVASMEDSSDRRFFIR